MTYLIILVIFIPVFYWAVTIKKHWRDKIRPRTWYWRIWWKIVGRFYFINWWWTGQKQYKYFPEPSRLRTWLHSLFIKREKVAGRENLGGQARPTLLSGERKVEILSLIRKTACGRHAWYATNVGQIRKPIQP